MMKYDTIEDGELTPLHEDGYSADSTTAAAPRTKKPTSSTFVRAVMVATTVGALLLWMVSPSKMMTMNKSSNADGLVVVSSATSHRIGEIEACYVATGKFNGLSCKDSKGWCAGPGEAWSERGKRKQFETCYVSNNRPPYDRCWSHSHSVQEEYVTLSKRCDPAGYNDGDDGYDKDGVWHVSTPLRDGSCGLPCLYFKKKK